MIHQWTGHCQGEPWRDDTIWLFARRGEESRQTI